MWLQKQEFVLMSKDIEGRKTKKSGETADSWKKKWLPEWSSICKERLSFSRRRFSFLSFEITTFQNVVAKLPVEDIKESQKWWIRYFRKLHPSKRCLFQTRIKILGHILDEQRIYPLDKIIARIQGAARPRSKDEIRAFIGVVGYYQKFIPQFAERAHHRQKLIGRDATFSWMDDQERCFLDLCEFLGDSNFWSTRTSPSPSSSLLMRAIMALEQFWAKKSMGRGAQFNSLPRNSHLRKEVLDATEGMLGRHLGLQTIQVPPLRKEVYSHYRSWITEVA